MNLQHIDTELRNPRTQDIDRVSTGEALRMMNREDHLVAQAVERVIPHIERAVDEIYQRVREGGRLIYVGCGTSGRLGVLDAVECPPTFGVSPHMVQGIIAGGHAALTQAIEGAEDDREQGAADLKEAGVTAQDAVVGIAASGRTPYVLGAMAYAKQLGAAVIAVTCSSQSAMEQVAHITIAPLPGPEVIAGSTRMKSGTAQKMVLNMLSTTLMVKLGKVYRNWMVDLKATNEKLVHRCVDIVCQVTGASREQAVRMVEDSGGSCKVAIVRIRCGYTRQQAQAALDLAQGHVGRVIEGVCGM